MMDLPAPMSISYEERMFAELSSKLKLLEDKQEKTDRVIENIKKILKGKNMDDFNFDDLLNDVENEAVETEVAETEVDDIDALLEPEAIPETADVDLDALIETPTPTPTPTPVQEVQETPETVNVTHIEFEHETAAYARAFLDIELQKKALQQEAKDLKDEYKDAGVMIAEVNKAMRELAKELKETPEQAQAVEDMKRLFRTDDSIYPTIVGLSD